MAEVASPPVALEESPRSTIILGAGMTTAALPLANGMNEINTTSDSVDVPPNVPSPSKGNDDAHLKGEPSSQDEEKASDINPNDGKKVHESPPTPSPHEYPSYLHASVYPNLTPQPRSGYYHGYAPQHTPEPASPAAQPLAYDVNAFFQHQTQAGAFHLATAAGNSFLGVHAAGGANSGVPLSPARGPMQPVVIATPMGSIPPASPLFPRVNSGPGLDSHRAPNLPYMSPQLTAYTSIGISSQSSDDGTGTWGGSDR